MNSNKNVYDTIIILWITFQSISVTYAQINPAGDNIQTGDVLEQMVESEDLSEFDYDTFLEYLDFLKANPINLNNATLTELRNTRLLSEIQIRDLLQHKKYYGSLLNIYELQTISSFTLNDINRIKPYIIVQQNNSA
ncbi:MAG: hypothetical protein KBF51_08015, partial [Chitinophagales bacterium]|nr:hypothetical protein [Chitinophagales bacterium]